ncbi:MAG TPA: SPOR domain-containing protein [Vicinamibacteria bacterium]
MAQDDYYYEIQLTNKQLVFYFMAGATGLILSFLAGVMVGRGVDSNGADVQASRPVVEERVVAEEVPKTAPPPAADLTYAQRLESEKTEDGLDRPKTPDKTEKTPVRTAAAAPAQAVVPKPGSGPAAQPPASRTAPPVAESKPAIKTAPPPVAAPASSSASSSAGTGFTVQVGAFKDKATADSVVTRLKGKGFAAYVMSPGATEGGLFVVRVGSYPQRTDAERVETKLRDQEKFRPYIVKN